MLVPESIFNKVAGLRSSRICYVCSAAEVCHASEHSFMQYENETWSLRENDMIWLDRNNIRMIRWMCNTKPENKDTVVKGF